MTDAPSGARPIARISLALAMTGVVALALALVLASPRRQLSGDTVPGRIGAFALRCTGSFDLRRIDWVHEMYARKTTLYFMHLDRAGEVTSLFGPGPAAIGALALPDVDEGATLSDAELRERERMLAALLVGLATALLVLAAAATVSLPRSLATGALALLSFAGAASLGQGLWQATTALPLLAGALATHAWRSRAPRVALVTPALLVLATMLRPGITPLCLALGLAWAHQTRRAWRTWSIAAGLSLAVSAPLVAWNAIHLSSPLPIGQWTGNLRMSEHVFTASAIPGAIAGLVASPGRGLLVFAPIVIVGVVLAFVRREQRWLAGGVLAQIVFMAAFFKWHGGQAFGPRLLAEATWIGCFLALGCGLAGSRVLVASTAALTIVVGQLGLWRFVPEQWERRRAPEANPSALWDVVDSPIAATLGDTRPPGVPIAWDGVQVASWRCEAGTVRTLR